jgi:LmbE family N-acetylglucosaminyl deacetylase
MKNLKLIVTGLMLICVCGASRNHNQNQNSNPANAEDISTWHGKTIIYFAPHPDDEIASSGTLATLTKNGNTVYVVVYCSGNAGTHDLDMTSESLARIRKQEDIAANKIVGIPEQNIFFLGYDDGMLEYVPQKEIVEKVCWYIRKYRPDAVFTLDPGSKYMVWHKTDHRAAALLSVDGARAAAYHLVFPQHFINEGLQSYIVRDWIFYESDGSVVDGNFKVDITDVARLKWEAACQHTSQMGKGNMKYTGSEMTSEDKETLRKIIELDKDGKVYEHFRRLQESLSF